MVNFFIACAVNFLIVAQAYALSSHHVIPTNANELRQTIMRGARPAKIESVTPELGCDIHGCFTEANQLIIWRDREFIQSKTGEKINFHQSAGQLPDLDWSPLAVFNVYHSSKLWGACLEFSHKGIGKSGSFQHWSSVVLVPITRLGLPTDAHRFVSYLASCHFLVEGDKPGEVVLPVIASTTNGSHRITWKHCTDRQCISMSDKPHANRGHHDKQR